MPKPNIKKFCKQTLITALINHHEGKQKFVSVDWKGYGKACERYIIVLEKRIKKLQAKVKPGAE